ESAIQPASSAQAASGVRSGETRRRRGGGGEARSGGGERNSGSAFMRRSGRNQAGLSRRVRTARRGHARCFRQDGGQMRRELLRIGNRVTMLGHNRHGGH